MELAATKGLAVMTTKQPEGSDEQTTGSPYRRPTGEECQQLELDIRTGLRAIGIYTDLLQRNIGGGDDQAAKQQKCCDGINAAVEELSLRLEVLRHA